MVSASPLTRSSHHAGEDFARLKAARAKCAACLRSSHAGRLSNAAIHDQAPGAPFGRRHVRSGRGCRAISAIRADVQRLRVRSDAAKGDGVEIVVADMTVSFKLLHESFTSRVTLDRPESARSWSNISTARSATCRTAGPSSRPATTPARSSSSSTTSSGAARSAMLMGGDVRHGLPPLGRGVRKARRRGLRPRLARPCYSSARTCGSLSTR